MKHNISITVSEKHTLSIAVDHEDQIRFGQINTAEIFLQDENLGSYYGARYMPEVDLDGATKILNSYMERRMRVIRVDI